VTSIYVLSLPHNAAVTGRGEPTRASGPVDCDVLRPPPHAYRDASRSEETSLDQSDVWE